MPAACLCISLFIVQAAIINYYLIVNISINHLSWVGLDLINLTLLIFCIACSHSTLHKKGRNGRGFKSLAWLSWLLISTSVAIKTIIAFNEFASHLVEDDPSFFGPNTLKTAIALGSCVFFLLLTTQHNSIVGSDRRRYIEELAGTVVFDILDTVDILEILFDAAKVELFWKGLKEIILAVVTMNLLIPTIPLMTLCQTEFGHHRPDPWVTNLHTFLIAVAVNLPILMVRLILWNVFSLAISPFTLKNCMLLSMTAYDFYQHRKVDTVERQRETTGVSHISYGKHHRNRSDEHCNTNCCEDVKTSHFCWTQSEERIVTVI